VDIKEQVRLAKKGEKQAFCILIRSFKKAMFRTAKRFGLTDEECADVMQEAILKAYESLKSLRKEEYFKAWLIQIVVNESKLYLRRNKRIILTDQVIEQAHDEIDYAQTMAVNQAVEALESDLKMIVQLYYFEDLSVKQISNILKIASGTVKSRLHRARKHLAHFFCMEDYLEGSGCNERYKN
jgi:RNA polymerase sigma-70 factor (ECF subfamily)